MVIALTVEILAAPPSYIGLRQFVVEIMQDVSNIHTPQERNVRLALEAFVNYKENQMKDWQFIPFVYGVRIDKAFKIPEKPDNGAMRAATYVHEPFRVKDIVIYEKTSIDTLFIPSKSGYSVLEVGFQEGMGNPEAILASSSKDALEALQSVEDIPGFEY